MHSNDVLLEAFNGWSPIVGPTTFPVICPVLLDDTTI